MRRVALVLFLAGCYAPRPAADAAMDDAGADAGRDTGPDAFPPPGPRWCGVCHTDADCGGSLCITLGDGTEHACGATCTSDRDCAIAGFAASCVEIDPGLPHQCVPPSGSCIDSPPASACSATTPCSGTFDVCLQVSGGATVCTARCNVDADCPIGMRRCVRRAEDRFCEPDTRYDAGSCATPRTMPAPVCACGTESASSISGQLLASLGLDACDLAFSSAAIDAFGPAVAHDRFRFDATDRIRSYAPEVPHFGHGLAQALDFAASEQLPVTAALSESAALADLDPLLPVLPRNASDLAAELSMLITQAGAEPNPTQIAAAVEGLSPAEQGTIAPIVRATYSALVEREQALAGLDDATRREAFDLASGLFLPGVGPGFSPQDSATQGLLLGDVREDVLSQAAIDLAATIETYNLPALGPLAIHFFMSTPAGDIVFSGASDDLHTNQSILLLIDFGGNDLYGGSPGATASITNGVSVVIDTGGVDQYGYTEVPVPDDTSGPPDARRLPSDGRGRLPSGAMQGPASLSITSRQGAGRLGIGMLFDLGTDDDTYHALRMSQGYGALGVGILYDEGGDDTYVGEAAVQGAGAFGIGLLYDRAGNDHYTAYAYAQGFGYVRGIGTLYDADGTDDYFAHPTDVLYFSPQNPGGSNSSFAQGAGFGRRDDTMMGVPMSGGFGVLRDAAGDDTYTVGIFGQGAGYWFGTGLLLDAMGTDHYDGWWYVHGSAAHFAAAALLDDGGNDTYQVANVGDPARSTSIGVGHDFSLGWLVDHDGDDIVHAPNLSLGGGNAAGFGFFVDLAGSDTYTATSGFSFGDASIETPGDTLRAMAGTIGLFIDRGGVDSYTRPTMMPVAENAMWQQTVNGGMGEHGGGVDTVSGTVGLGLD